LQIAGDLSRALCQAMPIHSERDVMRRPVRLLFAFALAAVAAAPGLPHYIAAAAANPARGDQRADDARRHGPEILAFAGVKPGDKVIDIIPGGAYWTRLFSGVVGAKGHVYGVWPQPYAAEAHKDVVNYGALKDNPAFSNVTGSVQPGAQLNVPEKVDLVFTSQNYHDYPDKFMGYIDPLDFDRAVYAALKSGGTFVIVDHAAEAGSGMRDTDTLHRIDPAIVKRQVIAVGFRLVGESDLLRNPADDHKLKVFDPAIRGHTDQFILKFRKP
jgi:predicted methyltransferase